MAEANEKRKSAPTEKMVAAAKTAAERHGVPLPENYEADFEVCKAFLDTYLAKPTAKALGFAEKIAKDKGLTIPDEARINSRDLSAWIDANKSA
jgi:DNA topoisomerase-3